MSPSRLNRWLLVQALFWTLALLGVGWIAGPSPATGWILAAAQAVIWVSFAVLWRLVGTGTRVADYATLARLLLLGSIVALIAWQGRVTWWLWAGLLLAVLGDLVDGWCARAFGGSDAGALLDMEADQFATLNLALVATLVSGAGLWTLLLPGLRYAFILAMRAAGERADDPKPQDGDNRQARLICAVVMSLLLICNLPTLATPLRWAASGLAVLLLSYSFSSDARFLLRKRRRLPTTG